ncbi:hypothetical protein FA13DRAFT_1739993 [Coprinellus micaceus]|uniref:Pre-rRNA-processing protein TSR2 n=1 Tax=Coprinellus micaceus TaxID=71717 RepID=A0A4Y7SPB4_COPMI|nr:hypothetical protein FA13DRAFT_1750019 [Coprinellus micaceus]TEB23541.1 hypothetical protein FA13DRAFT_1739993 [Coprinellus micaceus]
MSNQASSVTPIPNSSVLFARGVIARLSIWPVLRVALQESWGSSGGGDKKTLLASEIVDAFDQAELPDDEYVEDILLQIMEEEFEVGIEDGSAESVAKDIVKIYDDVKQGKTDLVQKFEELADKAKGKQVEVNVQKAASDDEDWEDDDGESDEDVEMDEDVPQLMQPESELRRREEPEIDEEGFTMVKKGKGRR